LIDYGLTAKQPLFSTSNTPSTVPSVAPSTTPSTGPSDHPSESPSSVLSTTPSAGPSVSPSVLPSNTPSTVPSVAPSSTTPSMNNGPSSFKVCLDTRQRTSKGWIFKGTVQTEAEARYKCTGYKHMSLECPHISGATGVQAFEVFCLDDNYEGSIANEECMGTPSDVDLNGGSNGFCTGPYEMDGLYLGGWHRGALYEVGP
jgi:hypothetical protein